MGYQNLCVCPQCSARSEGVASGELFYDPSGELRRKDMPRLKGHQATAAYMRDRDRKQRAFRLAA